MSYTNCKLSEGFILGCKNNAGGIKEVYMSTFSGGTSYQVNSENVITACTNYNTFYKFEQRMETGEFTQNGQHSSENGTNYWEQTVNLTFHKYDSAQRDLLFTLAQQQVVIIVKDNNGKYFLVGKTNGAMLAASTANAGKAFGDMNGVTISLLAKEPSPAQEVNQSLITTLDPQ